jgi:hypothetical protein
MNIFAFVVLFAQLMTQWPEWPNIKVDVTPERVNVKERFKVEPLKPDEVKQIDEVAAALSQAEGNYGRIINEVKEKHGQSRGGTIIGCNVGVARVQIRGQYALISTDKDYSTCPVLATSR